MPNGIPLCVKGVNLIRRPAYLMSRKRVTKPPKTKTHFDGRIMSKVTNASCLESCLDAGSKKRLKTYMSNLSVTRGLSSTGFDKEVIQLLSRYVRNKKSLKEALNYLGSLRDEDGHLFSRNLKIYSHCQEAIERFAEPDYTSFRWNENYRKSLKELRSQFSGLHLKPLQFCCDDDITDALPKSNTHSGFTWIETGKKKKGDNMVGALEKFKKRVENSTTSLNRPTLMAFRTQASGEYTEQGEQTGKCKHKLRVVLMHDLDCIINELQFSNPFQKVMNRDKRYAGGSNDEWISKRIHDLSSRFNYFLSIDYSHYDQSISSWLIEDAFSVVKCAFDLTEEYERMFDMVVYDFVHKSIVIDCGIVTANKGVLSGSMFTQIIDSIVNWLVIMTYCNAKHLNSDMVVMGDDNAVFFQEDVALTDLASYILHNFGLEVHCDDKTFVGKCRRDDVVFLSRTWKQDGPWRHPNELISRLAYPERFRVYDEGNVMPEHVIWGYILTYPSGMNQLIDVIKFKADFPIVRSFIENYVDSRYIPGALAFIKEYASEGTAA